MVFSDLTFLYLFLPIVLVVYALCPKIGVKNIWLLLASLFFYAWGEPVWVLLMIFTAGVNFFFGARIHKSPGKPHAKRYLIYAVAINLLLLGIFKYAGFAFKSLNMLIGLFSPAQIQVPLIGLPIGISFFTFQSMSYTIDVYRGDTPVQKNFAYFLMYVSLFPQLIAGPIVRYTDINEQILNRKITLPRLSYGVTRFLVGLGKKVIIGNYAGELSKELIGGTADLHNATVMGVWLGLFLYALQIYFDFSGYSDMAIGLGHMLGFEFLENFNYPYIATSITDFWRRWHMSLSTFFRDYVYIPLGGNRRFQIRNLFITWLLTGLWHGASWNFVLWGLYYFLFLTFEKFVLRGRLEKIPVLRRVYTLFVILLGWAFFYFEDFGRLFNALSVMLGFSGQPFAGGITESSIWANNYLFMIAAVVACIPVAKLVRRGMARLSKRSYRWDGATVVFHTAFNAVILLWCTAVLTGSTFNPFLYFRF